MVDYFIFLSISKHFIGGILDHLIYHIAKNKITNLQMNMVDELSINIEFLNWLKQP
jgi:hypothetical protein